MKGETTMGEQREETAVSVDFEFCAHVDIPAGADAGLSRMIDQCDRVTRVAELCSAVGDVTITEPVEGGGGMVLVMSSAEAACRVYDELAADGVAVSPPMITGGEHVVRVAAVD